MARASLHPAVILLVYSIIASLTAASLTRHIKLLQGAQGLPPLGDAQEAVSEEDTMKELIIRGRMDLASIDYDGPGSNIRHTPPPREKK